MKFSLELDGRDCQIDADSIGYKGFLDKLEEHVRRRWGKEAVEAMYTNDAFISIFRVTVELDVPSKQGDCPRCGASGLDPCRAKSGRVYGVRGMYHAGRSWSD